MTKIEIRCQPTEIQEGTMVRLTASAPAKIRSDCTWRVVGPGADAGTWKTPEPPRPGIVIWNTTGLQPGSYTIYVTAELAATGSKGSVATTEGTGEIDVDVLPRSVSSQDVERLAKGAKEFAQHLKDNLDCKMDSLTAEVSKVATGVGVLGGQQLKVVLQRPDVHQTDDEALWSAIRHHTEMIGFNRYRTTTHWRSYSLAHLRWPPLASMSLGRIPVGEPDFRVALQQQTFVGHRNSGQEQAEG